MKVKRLPLWERVLGAAIFGGGALFFLIAGWTDDDITGWGRLALVVGCAFVLGIALRLVAVRVALGGETVTVVNIFRRIVVPWNDVARFEFEREWGEAYLQTRSGDRHKIWALSPGRTRTFTFDRGVVPPSALRRSEREVAELEQRRKNRRRQGGGRDRGPFQS